MRLAIILDSLTVVAYVHIRLLLPCKLIVAVTPPNLRWKPWLAWASSFTNWDLLIWRMTGEICNSKILWQLRDFPRLASSPHHRLNAKELLVTVLDSNACLSYRNAMCQRAEKASCFEEAAKRSRKRTGQNKKRYQQAFTGEEEGMGGDTEALEWWWDPKLAGEYSGKLKYLCFQM